MLKKNMSSWSFLAPLSAHAGMHAIFTFFIAIWFCFHRDAGSLIAVVLAVVDFTVHFLMDRIKASPHMLGRYKAAIFEFAELQDRGRGGAAPGSMVSSAEERINEHMRFWWSLGFDQMVHHFTNFVIIYILVHL